MGGLVLINTVQIRLQRLPGGGLLIQFTDITGRSLANAQAAKQFVGVHQFRAQHFSQFTPGQAAHDFHLEQPILCLHIPQRPVHIQLIARADVRHTALVVTHGDGLLQCGQLNLALTRGQFALHVPDSTPGHGGDD